MTVTKNDVDELRETIVEMHDRIIERSGGEKGIRDKGGLDHGIYILFSYLESRKDKPIEIAARIFDVFATRHYFVDGNKRTAYVLAKETLLNFGYYFKVHYKEAVIFIMEIADGKRTLHDIEEWITNNSKPLKGDIEGYIADYSTDIEEIKRWQKEH